MIIKVENSKPNSWYYCVILLYSVSSEWCHFSMHCFCNECMPI